MNRVRNMVERIRNWLRTGTKEGVLIRRILMAAVAMLVIYRMGYVLGKLLFHIGP